MGNKMKSFASVVALGFVLLFFGPAMSNAQAQSVSFQGHFPLPHGSISIQAGNRGYHGNGSYYRHSRPDYRGHYRRARPHSGRYYKHYRPYRLVRVYVYTPYPHWAVRRVYHSQPVGAYRRPY